MKRSFIIFSLVCKVVVLADAMTPQEIALTLLSCPSFRTLAPEDGASAQDLVCRLLRVANNDVDTIRAGLEIYQQVVSSPGIAGTEVQFSGVFTVPVLFAIMFERPRGRFGDFPMRSTKYSPRKRSIDDDIIIEYSLPISVGEDGVVELAWILARHAGHVSSNFVAMLDGNVEQYPLRKINFTIQPCDGSGYGGP